MILRPDRQRWWLALAYCLTVVLAPGVHSHGDHDPVAAHQGETCPSDCGEPADGDDLLVAESAVDCDPGECPSCQFQLTHQVALPSPDRAATSEPRGSPTPRCGLLASAPSSRPHNRGPPLA